MPTRVYPNTDTQMLTLKGNKDIHAHPNMWWNTARRTHTVQSHMNAYVSWHPLVVCVYVCVCGQPSETTHTHTRRVTCQNVDIFHVILSNSSDLQNMRMIWSQVLVKHILASTSLPLFTQRWHIFIHLTLDCHFFITWLQKITLTGCRVCLWKTFHIICGMTMALYICVWYMST